MPWVGLLRAKLTEWYTFAVFIPPLYWLARRFPLGRSRWAAAILVHLLASLLCALLKESLLFLVADWFRPGVFSLRKILAGDYFSEVMSFWALIGLMHALIYYRDHARRAGSAAEAPPASGAARTELQFTVRDRGIYRIVPAASVSWIDAQGNYARLHTSGGNHLVRETMAALEERLGPRFLRVHRRAIVNLDRVRRIEPQSHGVYRIVLSCGDSVVSGRSYNQRLRAVVG